MVNIIINGRDKVFYQKCANCATEFEYQLADVEYVSSGHPYVIGTSAVKCPSCGEYVNNILLTKEEYDKAFRNYPYTVYVPNCGV